MTTFRPARALRRGALALTLGLGLVASACAPEPTPPTPNQAAAHNAGVVREIFAGATGPIRDAVVLNSGVALAVASGDRVTDEASLDAALTAGIERARRALDEGAAAATLERWRAATVAAGQA